MVEELSNVFETILRIDPDGTKECNYYEDIRDDQCEVCLDTIIRDWYILKSHKRHIGTQRAVCLECLSNG